MKRKEPFFGPAWSTAAIPRRYLVAIVVGIIGLFLMALDVPRAAAREADTPPIPVGKGEIFRGGLYFPLKDGSSFLPAPLVATAIEGHVNGMAARFTVRHRYRNPGSQWVEGIYVFPLPDKSAVDSLRMRIGERIIDGRIEERAQAKRTYAAAKKSGRKAGLVEQERPNIFTSSIANIGPGEEISVEIQFQQSPRYADGAFRLRLPLVVGPRYIPGTRPVAGFGGTGWAVNTVDVPDARRITPPVRAEADGPGNSVSLRLDLAAGFALASLTSPSHGITVNEESDGRRVITLADGEVPADRDLVLEWRPKGGEAPSAGLFRETVKGQDYVLLMLMPPTAAAKAGIPREAIFVVDTSGSMHGRSLAGAKEALNVALDALKPGDRFNIIQFNDQAQRLFAGARTVTAKSIAKAHAYVDFLSAEGGTEMRDALRLALDGRTDPNRLRQVVLLTDGAIGNEAGLFADITGKLGDSRLFTVGIGSAPNGYFMTRAARHGRGTYTYIGKVAEVRDRMTDLLMKLGHPALTNVHLAWPDGIDAEVWPKRTPDLYRGEPLVALARIPTTASGPLAISGRLGDGRWQITVPLAGGQQAPGVGRLWAREKIASVIATLANGSDPAEVRKLALETALEHQLVSRYTSLVAVDVTPSRPDGTGAITRPVPTNMPHGWSREHVFGKGAGKKAAAPPIPGNQEDLMFVAPVKIGSPSAAPGIRLPQTATSAPVHAILGLSALTLGLFVLGLAARPRRRPA